MSTNDDSASRRGRRPEQGGPDRRPSNRHDFDDRRDQSPRDRDSGDPYQDQRGRDNQAARGSYSGFSRHSYPPPRPEPLPPVPPQQPRGFDPQPPQLPQGYYQDPPNIDATRSYLPPSPPSYAPPPQSYPSEPPSLGYNTGGRDDLFGRDPAPPSYEHSPYASQDGAYHADPYDQNPARPPMVQPAARDDGYFQRETPSPQDDYERGFAGRIAAQESQASRFYLPEDQPAQRPAQLDRGYPAAAPPPMDRGYAPSQQYGSNSYAPAPEPQPGYGQDHYDPRYAAHEAWTGDEHGLHGDVRGGALQQVHQGDELDEDFFADEDDLDNDPYLAPKRGRKKLVAATLVGAIALGGGGAYLYKSMKGGGGENATPVIRADNRPLKDAPSNPGGKQFPNGEKAIYDRLMPNGQQIQSAALAPSGPAGQFAAPPPAAGNSLEDRIEEALKKAQRSGDAPPQGVRTGPDQPTVVRSESYRPDGTRVDGLRPVIQPNVVNVNGGQLPPPFGSGVPTALPSGQPPAAAFRAAPVPVAPPPQQFASITPPAPKSVRQAPAARTAASFTPAADSARATAPAPANGFYVSLKSAPDEKAIQRDLPSLNDKYKAVLGEVQLTSKIADLGSKGITYRAVAGPLGSQQEAADLCQKIKGAGGTCFVTK